MIESFIKAWFANQESMRNKFSENHPDSYMEVVRAVIEMLYRSCLEYDRPDPKKIHEIDDGDYQGTLVYVVSSDDYQPNKYWYVKVGYGSCSVCDTLKSIREGSDERPTDAQVSDYMTLALHIVQGLREMGDGEEE
ncbi:MAG TPA: hypothetical protein VFM46_05315 [Pseudomonadales bacterium]|nr:hypothetical protein [Pseudomonadales bacterium]